MIRKILFLLGVSLMLISCQFTETMVLNEDGSGTISVEVDLSEMMAFGGMDAIDSSVIKMDTIISVKQFLEENRDSIASLSKKDQIKLKKLENYNIRLKMNSESSEMIYNISTTFKSVNEANDMIQGLDKAGDFIPGTNENPEDAKKEEESPDIIGVNYSFINGVFKRDAYIKDKKLHRQEVDSLQQTEAFLQGSNYTLNYTFPKPIKKVSNTAATLSNNKKTLTLQKAFIDYFKNPDLLDLEVELEN